MALDQVKIVDAVSASANVRLDLNDGTTWLTTYESDLTPPPLSRAVTSNLMTDGGYVSAAAYPDRVLKLVLEPAGSTADALALEIQKIARELDRADGTNYLKWQPAGATHDVYFPLKRSDFASIREVVGGKRRLVQANLLAGPFGLGLPVGPTTYTVNFDPAAGSNGCFFDMSGSVKGDVDTPLYMVTGDADLTVQQMYYAVRSRGTPSNVTWFQQAEALTDVSGDVTTTADGTASGGNMARCNFGAGDANAVRLSGSFPNSGTGSTDWQGTYRVIARLKRTAGTVNVQLRAGGTVLLDQVSVDSASWYLYDLGLVEFPTSNTGRVAGHGAAHVTGPTTLELFAERSSGAGNLDVDFIELVPADQSLAVVKMTSTSSSRKCVLDGPNSAVYRLNSSSELDPASVGGYFDGRLPRVDPRATTNRVFVIPSLVDLNAFPLTLSGSAAFDVTYWPRYLYVRPAST